MKYLDVLLTLSLPALVLLHLYVSPYTKVEESFNLQATHDILTYGIPTKDIHDHFRAEYDHLSFPGVVPRTFTGALLLAAFSKPGIWLMGNRQLVVRGVLGSFNVFALLAYRWALASAFGRTTGNWYLVFQACQFHVIYYASRTLPNMFAFGPTTLALSYLLPTIAHTKDPLTATKRYRLSIYLLTLSAVIFRSEISILLATHAAQLLLRRRISLTRLLLPSAVGGALIGLWVSVPIDSFFWQKPLLWPELVGFYYNAIAGKSANWGTSPWWFYFVNALPKLLMNPMTWQLCVPIALAMQATRAPSLDILLPLLAFVGIYSVQPHKEWRFIVYVVPGLTAVAALGANHIWIRRSKSAIYRFLSLVLIASSLASLFVSFAMLAISSLNYPGAEALNRVHTIALDSFTPSKSQTFIRIHMDTLSCVTGVTRFLEKPSSMDSILFSNPTQPVWIYDKTEDKEALLTAAFWARFDYALSERPELAVVGWEVVDIVKAYNGVQILHPGEGEIAKDIEASAAILRDGGLLHWWNMLEQFMREHVTKGWWVGVRMDPRIHVLRRQKHYP